MSSLQAAEPDKYFFLQKSKSDLKKTKTKTKTFENSFKVRLFENLSSLEFTPLYKV